jgi:HAE1 family hydrophobic/amphiphilic exporter-1
MANLDGLALAEAQQKVQAVADEVVPPEMSTKFIGMVEIMEESFGHMLFAHGLAIVMVYMILAAQFNSFWQPIAIMISLPLSFVGAFGDCFLRA